MTETRFLIGGIVIVLGILVIAELFIPLIEIIFRIVSFNMIMGIILILIGITLVQAQDCKIEQRKDKK